MNILRVSVPPWCRLRVCRHWTLIIALCVVSLSGTAYAAGELRLTDDGKRKFSPVFLPDGESIAYCVHDEPTNVVVKRLSLEDSSEELMFPDDTAHQFDPAFSPDGRYWCYCRSGAERQLVLVVRDRQSQGAEKLFLPSGGLRSTVRSLTVTPDGTRILFTISCERGLQIASLNMQLEDLKFLTESEGTSYWPSVSPDGTQIVFSSSRDGAYDLYVMDSGGGNVRRLTNSPTRDVRPKWSPDGGQIAFTSARDGNYEIYVIDTDGGNLQRVTDHPEADDFATWHPNASSLVLVAERDGRFDLYRIAVP